MPQDKTGHFYYSWFPTAYQADTQHLSLAECGAYRRLIDHYMLTRTPLPGDSDRSMARILGVGVDEWLAVKPVLEPMFKPTGNPPGLWSHTFCDEQLSQQTARIERSRTNGKGGGRPKKVETNEQKPSGFISKTQQEPMESYKASKAAKESNISIPLPLSTVHSLPDDLQGKDFNNFEEACFACLLLAGAEDGVLPTSEQQIVIGWMSEYDMNWAIPIVASQMAGYVKKNRGARPSSLAYFSKRLAERHMMEGGK